MKRMQILSIAAVLITTAAASASTPLSLAGLAGTGVTADVSFGYAGDATSGIITISITNTTLDSGETAGSYISAFGFNVPSMSGVTFTAISSATDGGGVVELVSPPNGEAGWYAKFASNSIGAPGGYNFDFGVMNNGTANFIHDGMGGSTLPKIYSGETTTFSLLVVGLGLDVLSDSSFLNELSTSGDSGAFNFAVRFQSIGTAGLSDLATTVVPVPASVLLGILGLFGVGVNQRKKTLK